MINTSNFNLKSEHIQIIKDLANLERVILGQLK